MFIPVGDTPNPQGKPYLTYLLILVNTGVFLFISFPLTLAPPDLNDPLLMEYLKVAGVRGSIPVQTLLQHVSAYDLFIFRHGYRPSDPSLESLFTAMFLHGGWMHLIGNMLFLWIFGDNVEARLGRFWYLAGYLGTGVAATLFFALFVPDSPVPLVGASGAISGILGCYFIWFPRNNVKVFIFLFPFLMNIFLVPARLVLGFYLLIDNLLPFLVSAGGGATGVAHGAHIGGFLAGVGIALTLNQLSGLGGFSFGKKAEERTRSPLERIAISLRQGHPYQASVIYLALSEEKRRQVPPSDRLAIGEYLLSRGDYREALALFRRYIGDFPSGPALDRAYLGAGKALMQHPMGMTGASQYFLGVLDLTQDTESAEEARRHLERIKQARGR